MKTKRTVFEVNDVYRVMENSELIYTLTNSEKLKREEYKYEQMEIEGLCLSDVLETLTPSRKKVAYAAIELYKRLKEGQVESPALLSSNNVYLKSATKLFSVLLASKRPLITELADKLRLKYPLLPTISPCPTMRLEAIRSIIPISCRRYPKSV